MKNFEKLKFSEFKFESSQNTINRGKRDLKNQINNLIVNSNRLIFNAYGRFFLKIIFFLIIYFLKNFLFYFREFILHLKHELSFLSDNLKIEVHSEDVDGRPKIDLMNNSFAMNNYVGFVEGEYDSSVVCYFDEGENSNDQPIIYAQIRLGKTGNKEEIFYIEPSPSSDQITKNNTNYIIYRAADVESGVLSNGIFK